MLGHQVPVFVIGTGSSGTNLVGRLLATHPQVRGTIEEEPMFGLSIWITLYPSIEEKVLPYLVSAYHTQLKLSSPKHYVDKSHMNIWVAERLKAAFPQALFVGVERSPYAVVASMLKRKGMLNRQRRWRKYQIPNRFLGIDMSVAKYYDELPRESQCALRWLTHHREMTRLRGILNRSLIVLNYEELVLNTEREVGRLQEFVPVTSPIVHTEVRDTALNKWRHELSDIQLMNIANVVNHGQRAT